MDPMRPPCDPFAVVVVEPVFWLWAGPGGSVSGAVAILRGQLPGTTRTGIVVEAKTRQAIDPGRGENGP